MKLLRNSIAQMMAVLMALAVPQAAWAQSTTSTFPTTSTTSTTIPPKDPGDSAMNNPNIPDYVQGPGDGYCEPGNRELVFRFNSDTGESSYTRSCHHEPQEQHGYDNGDSTARPPDSDDSDYQEPSTRCHGDEVYLVSIRAEAGLSVASVGDCVPEFDPSTTVVDPPYAPRECPEGLICQPCEFDRFVTMGVNRSRITPFYRGCGADTYVVKPGDTFWGIAERYYGSGFEWTKLCSEYIDDPRHLPIDSIVGFC